MTAGVVAVAVLAVGFLFLGSNQKVYACSTQVTPTPSPTPGASTTTPSSSPTPSASASPSSTAKSSASVSPSAASPSPSPSPSPTPVLGQPEPDMGYTHIPPGTFQRYTYCPPASGNHYSAAGLGPISPVRQVYGPDDQVVPQSWIHNLEHGGLVVLYSCKDGCPDDPTKQQFQQFYDDFPASPICHIPAHVLSPVVARFDDMSTKYAAVVWDRVLLLDTFDQAKILAFFNQWADKTNREKQCASPSPSPVPGTSASPSTSESPAGSPSPSGASPSPSPS
jgi:hypothetical protein